MKTVKLNNKSTTDQINKMVKALNEHCQELYPDYYHEVHLDPALNCFELRTFNRTSDLQNNKNKVKRFDTQEKLHSFMMTFFTKKGAK